MGGERHDQLWRSGRGAIAGSHCSVLRLEWTWCHCWVPLQGANFCFISFSYIQGHQFHLDIQSRRYTVLYMDITKIGFGYLGSMLV